MQTYRTGFAHPLDELRDELDRLWGNLVAAPPLHGWGSRPSATDFPAVNIRETDDAVIVEAELPGLDAASLDIAVTGDELVLKGSRPQQPEAVQAKPEGAQTKPEGTGARPEGGNGERKPAVTWHRRERGTGSFERRLTLPVAVDAGKVEARLADGVLTVTCPKAPEAQPHKVRVRSA
ncbi:MAG: Hsp20/alpha crystallin family protein [Planctomycetia bacterium]